MELAHKIPTQHRDAFVIKTEAIALRIGVNAQDLMAIMDFESAGTFSPSIQNKGGNNYFGLIQFGTSAAKDLGTSLNKLKQLSALEQLDYVEAWFMLWRKRRGAITNFADLYLTVLLPKGIGYGLTDALPFTAKQIQQNKGLCDGKGRITKASILKKFAQRYPWILAQNNIKDAVQQTPDSYITSSNNSFEHVPQVAVEDTNTAQTMVIGAAALVLIVAIS